MSKKLAKHQKNWGQYTPDELVKIAKMLDEMAYGSIDLNCNDTFAFGCAHGVELMMFDMLAVAELYEKYGSSGVFAWCANQDEIPGIPFRLKHFNNKEDIQNYKKAIEQIEIDPNYYSWYKSMNKDKNEPT